MATPFYVMKKPFIIRSLPDDQGRFWAASQESETTFSVGWFHKDSDIAVRMSEHAHLPAALSRLVDMARYDKLAIDFSSFKVAVGELIVVQTECRDRAREEVRIFRNQADYDEFRRARLADYDSNNDDASEVEGLLESGNLELAWETACADDGCEKALWDSHFGSHSVERIPNVVAFTDLPAWCQNVVKEAL